MARMLIAGQSVDSESGRTDEIRNPATGEVVDTVPKGTLGDVRRAIEAADAAFPSWSGTPSSRRGDILYEGAALILKEKDNLARLLTCEQGKPLREAGLEIERLIHTLRHYAGLGKEVRGGHVLLDQGRYGLILKLPIGVCGAIVPWNFPVALMGNKIAPALLAGNTVVVKPAGTTPLADIRCIELLNQAGLPPGALNIVTGPGSVVGQEILENSKVRKIGFTGATDTGRRVMEAASREIKRVTLELGGSDPMIVCDDADLDKAASAASAGRFFNCGQACLAIKRLYLFESIADEFIDKLVGKARKLVLGNGLERGTMVGPLHSAAQRQEIEEQVEDAVKRGATVLFGAKRPVGAAYEKGFFYLPTLLTDVDESSRVVQEEVFGPALPIIRVKDLDEGIAKANSSIFGLGSSIWTRDLRSAMIAGERIQSGYTWINSHQIIYDELPFGGFKQSGVGKEHGIEALDHYTETKSVVIAV
ncbi:MAG: aldehyde dehydrogenase [Acidobacteria bacterium]|nr:aldehyde dehydrogenase [Acidobacteriota bacterium]